MTVHVYCLFGIAFRAGLLEMCLLWAWRLRREAEVPQVHCCAVCWRTSHQSCQNTTMR